MSRSAKLLHDARKPHLKGKDHKFSPKCMERVNVRDPNGGRNVSVES